MNLPRRLTPQNGFLWLAVAGLLGAFLIGIVALVFAMSGLYNVSAAVKHFQITEKLIQITLHRSISFHSDDEVPVDLKDQNLARLGARHFDLGCAPCHGAPGTPASVVMQSMYPTPPDLTRAVDKFTPGELAWIIENGLKYTGMPSWPGHGRKDEVWPLVAFLHQLPDMGLREYSQYAGAVKEVPSSELSSCNSCHGGKNRPPVAPMVPSLSGQSATYLQRALTEYRSGTRQSGMMEPIAAKLDDAAIQSSLIPLPGSPVRHRTLLRWMATSLWDNGSQHPATRRTQYRPACLATGQMPPTSSPG
ncbi:c-type cytochrome [Roseibium salinum]|uniref:c-type cytochrome n=1 Tax=Roseibium salinum TaxID=1604349 RepID=UPI0036061CDE